MVSNGGSWRDKIFPGVLGTLIGSTVIAGVGATVQLVRAVVSHEIYISDEVSDSFDAHDEAKALVEWRKSVWYEINILRQEHSLPLLKEPEL